MIRKVTWEEQKQDVLAHLHSLPKKVDSYIEERILESSHYQILNEQRTACVFGVYQEGLLSYFHVPEGFVHARESLFLEALLTESIREVLVMSADEALMNLCLRFGQRKHYGAHQFDLLSKNIPFERKLSLEPARQSDVPMINQHAPDFFEMPYDLISKEGIFIVRDQEKFVGFGVVEYSTLYPDTASIGMFVLDSVRRQGYGARILQELKARMDERSICSIAGCWYYNHLSKKTLEKAGFYSRSVLYRFEV